MRLQAGNSDSVLVDESVPVPFRFPRQGLLRLVMRPQMSRVVRALRRRLSTLSVLDRTVLLWGCCCRCLDVGVDAHQNVAGEPKAERGPDG